MCNLVEPGGGGGGVCGGDVCGGGGDGGGDGADRSVDVASLSITHHRKHLN